MSRTRRTSSRRAARRCSRSAWPKRSEPDTVKVLDFGLVKESAREEPALAAENTVLGTPLNLSPEAILSPGTVDARSDLYSLGAVAYLLLTGTPVFSAESAIELCAKHLHAVPERPSERLRRALPEDLEALVLSCLEKAPEQRPESALALRSALDAFGSRGAWGATEAAAWWQAHASHVDARHRAQRRAASFGARAVAVARPRSA